MDAAIRILDALGDSPQVAAARARAYLAQYELTQQREWAEKAIAASRLATVEGSQEAGAYETLGRVQLLLGKPLAATRELERAVASQPNSVEARFALAAALDQLGRASEAEAALRGAVALQPGWWGTHSHLGIFLVTKGRFAESLPILREAIRLSPDNTRAIGNLGIAYQQLGRYEEALAEYRRSITIRPTPEALSNLATCEFVLGRYSEAAETYHRAIALQAGNGVLWRNLGDALRWTGGREAETRSAYLRAIDLLEADLAVTPGDADLEMDLAFAYGRTGQPRPRAPPCRSSARLGACRRLHPLFGRARAADRERSGSGARSRGTRPRRRLFGRSGPRRPRARRLALATPPRDNAGQADCKVKVSAAPAAREGT